MKYNYEWVSSLKNNTEFRSYPLQFANLKRIEKNNVIYIFDEVGTGKTITSGLMASHYVYNTYDNSFDKPNNYLDALVITINSNVKDEENKGFEGKWRNLLGFKNGINYKGNNIRNLKVKCKCGNVYTVSLANYVYNDVIRCPQCTKKESRGERIIREFLEANKINFQQEQRFSDCVDKRTLPFDFYLPEYNTCIEFDGQHHYFPIYNDDIHFEITKKHDKIKTQYCDNNNIKLIRIPYWQGENINSILQKELCI